MPKHRRSRRGRPSVPRAVSTVAACAALVLGSLVAGTAPAGADTAPADPNNPATPVTVSSDPLPTVQHDGVAWQQTVIGDTVYVVGRFGRARPAGAAPGVQTTPRNNILAFRLSTGQLVASFTPNLNGQALAVTASPDGRKLYVGGDFTAVNGSARSRVAALDPATGALIAGFAPKIGGSVRALAATNDRVYIGGSFTAVGSASRQRLAAVRAADGALLPWNPKADNQVNALALSPSANQVVIGGRFTTLNGSNRPGYGLGRVDSNLGANLPLGVNNTVRNAGKDSAVLSLSSDGTNFYGSGYIYGTGGNLEGTFSGRWNDGNLNWVEDCHGDSYGIWASPTAVYVAGHSHYCGNLGGFPETKPRTWHRGVAFSRAATGVLTKDIHGYPSFTGVPAPSLLNWFPDLNTGSASGQNQGPWAVAGNRDYVVMAGEFTRVNGGQQQGIVRFGVRNVAPNTDGPRISGAAANPTVSSPAAQTVNLSWPGNWDRDNERLSYQVIRDGNTQVYSTTATSRFYRQPTLRFTDTGVRAGSHTYRIVTRDPLGNTVQSQTVSVTVK
ncbi:hypothetical protein MUK71_05135 [Arthrobacter zhangbolii]|uniref:Fibronectin type-III domain-containing protein n=1 Tax=Arthrobacter zhangbolii TaxID=2886936 RepID=A0A9X1M826_9MICC|nr:hypothetical protein [Arthrobacter zhangbolii]MCC3272961.1 hypothetical protein [Arthrobacter zhangbolii]UON93010.1 hypothetical protein MUK71_05135 [Arthrobacter zhangbolii]